MPGKRRLIVTKQVEECLVVVSHAPNTHGYPFLWKDGRPQHMHRVLYEEMFGALAPGLVVRHRCDNRMCINLKHLEPGTPFENATDRNLRGRNNPPYGERAGNVKLTEEQVAQIRAIEGKSQSQIAKKFGVDQSHICKIRKGQRWGHAD